MISVGVLPSNGSRAVTASYRTTPSEKMSDRPSTGRPSACSGDMYETVPRITPAMVICACVAVGSGCRSANFARPKSRTFTTPRPVSIRFALLMSRCTIPCPCASSSASATCTPISAASRTPSGPRVSFSDSTSPSTYSIAMNADPPYSPMS